MAKRVVILITLLTIPAQTTVFSMKNLKNQRRHSTSRVVLLFLLMSFTNLNDREVSAFQQLQRPYKSSSSPAAAEIDRLVPFTWKRSSRQFAVPSKVPYSGTAIYKDDCFGFTTFLGGIAF
mmetsp:Transcript_207/g.281  ORF Transcript_207/g.281 Transcript_207/m.281 type:complete len:121 (+) Transcript_207:95-457(+)